ncbi:MAG: AAA family ATPase [Solirubrobacterales bacterium]
MTDAPVDLGPLDLDEPHVAAFLDRMADRLNIPEAEDDCGRQPKHGLAVVTARQLCARPDPPESDELLGPLLVRRQRTVIGGYTGEGRTTLSLWMARTVAQRQELLGWQGAGGRVLVIDAEQGERSIKRRLREVGLEASEDLDYLHAPDGLSLDTEDGEAEQVEALLAEGRYALVVLDPLYKLHRGDSNEERQAVDLMRRFDGWRERFGFALLMLVHCRKPPAGARFSLHEFFGSSAYTRGAEVVAGLQRRRPGYSHLHFFKDRDGDLPVGEAWGLIFDREEGFRRDPEDGKAKVTTEEQVRDLVEADPDITTEALMEATGKAERTVRAALTKIGAVGAGKPKRWRLPEPAGQEGLDV